MDSSDHNYPQNVDASNLGKRLTMGRYITRRPVDLKETWQAAHQQLNLLHQIQFR